MKAALPDYMKLFQFHIGAIRMEYDVVNGGHTFRFQFHIGAIRITIYVKLPAYNQLFQFHIGAIRIRPDFGWKVAILLKTES